MCMSGNSTLFPVADVEQHDAIVRLTAVSQMVNQAVGDALSCVLMVEAILLHRKWSIADWDKMYSDLPSRQLKVSPLRLGLLCPAFPYRMSLMVSGVCR